ncbi:MAG: hypothetical protein ACKOBZ_04380 [Nitrospira sp.]|nr:hypothetical protein [Nitrospira sp.]
MILAAARLRALFFVSLLIIWAGGSAQAQIVLDGALTSSLLATATAVIAAPSTEGGTDASAIPWWHL